MSWHTQSIRPITRADVGRFVVGFGVAGRVCGYVERMHGDYLVIDTGRNSGPMGGNIPADVIQRYTFLDVPQWAEDEPRQSASVSQYGSRKQSRYEPQRRGWVVVRDMFGNLVWSADHSKGGAQEALQARFDELQADGWTLEGLKFDMQFANRNGERVLIGIYPNDPLKPLPVGIR